MFWGARLDLNQRHTVDLRLVYRRRFCSLEPRAFNLTLSLTLTLIHPDLNPDG